MNDDHTDRQLDARRQAAKFLASRAAGWSTIEAEAYARWLAADFEHERAAEEMETTDVRLRQLHRSVAAADLLAEANTIARAKTRRRFRGWLQVAAPFAIAACVFLVLAVRRAPSPDPVSLFAARPRMVDLSDGSTLRMDSGAEVSVQFHDGVRRIQLRQGAVHFAVAKDTARPFVVVAGDVQVRAVGTAFDVRWAAAAVEVVVTEGKVAVSRGDPNATRPPLLLMAGERTAIPRAALAAATASRAVKSADELVTKHGSPRLEFVDTPLADVVRQFNAYSRTQLEIGDAELASRPVGGSFDADRADVFVDLLASAGDIRIERISETHVLLRKAR